MPIPGCGHLSRASLVMPYRASGDMCRVMPGVKCGGRQATVRGGNCPPTSNHLTRHHLARPTASWHATVVVTRRGRPLRPSPQGTRAPSIGCPCVVGRFPEAMFKPYSTRLRHFDQRLSAGLVDRGCGLTSEASGGGTAPLGHGAGDRADLTAVNA